MPRWQEKPTHVAFFHVVQLREADGRNFMAPVEAERVPAIAVPMEHITGEFALKVFTWDGISRNVQGLPVYRE